MTFDPASYTCYNCGERGHFAAACPAKIPAEPTAKGEHHMPSDDTIRQRILRIYQPASESEMAGLVNTWKQHYVPGAEHAMAPRYPPAFLEVLAARRQAHSQESVIGAEWCADIREMLRVRTQVSTEVRR